MRNLKWEYRFLNVARLVATWSKDPSTQVGSVIVKERKIISTGYNGFPPGADDSPELYADRTYKYANVIHAEPNALTNANGSVEGCDLFCTLSPCTICAAKIRDAGIARVFCPPTSEELKTRWGDSLKEAALIFSDAGIELIELGETQ